MSGQDQLPRDCGRYQLFDQIGKGGMANIYLALADGGFGAGKRLVVKEILPSLADDERFVAMLREEAKLAARLNHANVVQVFDLGRSDKSLYIAMEYVEGFDLNQLLRALSKRKMALPLEFSLFILLQVLKALDYAHRATNEDGVPLKIVHRDVSPSNVLISFSGEVRLCDFGIAKALYHREDLATPVFAGKSAYMAPEQARAEDVDHRADLFSAAIVLWELCAGRRLYKGSDEEMLAMAKAAEIPSLPHRHLPAIDTLDDFFVRAMNSNPDARFQTASEMAAALREYVHTAQMIPSQIRLGEFLSDHFAEEIISLRRARERSVSSPPPPFSEEDTLEHDTDAQPSDDAPSDIESAPEHVNGDRSSQEMRTDVFEPFDSADDTAIKSDELAATDESEETLLMTDAEKAALMRGQLVPRQQTEENPAIEDAPDTEEEVPLSSSHGIWFGALAAALLLSAIAYWLSQ